MKLWGCWCTWCGETYETKVWRPPWICDDCLEGIAHTVNAFTRPRKGEYRKAS